MADGDLYPKPTAPARRDKQSASKLGAPATTLTPAEMIRATAEGLIRNYGSDAADEAERIARRHTLRDTATALWLAVADEIRAIRRQ